MKEKEVQSEDSGMPLPQSVYRTLQKLGKDDKPLPLFGCRNVSCHSRRICLVLHGVLGENCCLRIYDSMLKQ
jgi:hypothetical protein